MKKLLQILLAMGIMALILQFIINLFITKHNINYSVMTDNNKYLINEIYSKEKDICRYSFQVTDGNNKAYYFDYDRDFNNQERVITTIKYYKSNDLECIFPIYRGNNTGNISCRLNNIETTYSYLLQIGNPDLSAILKQLDNEKYNYSDWLSSNITKNYNQINVYEDNIPNNYSFTVWFYHGIYIVNKTNTVEKNLLEEDHYTNNLAMLADKYYVIINTDNKPLDYAQAIVYNIRDGGGATVDLPNLSLNTYINGVFKDKLYLTDIDNKKEYELDATNNTIKEIGNSNKGYQGILNGKMIAMKEEELINNRYVFSNNINNADIISKYSPIEIKKYSDNYFYRDKTGNVYEIVGNKTDNPILLFNLPNISTWQVKDGAIVIVSNDTVYIYTSRYGLKPIIKDNELLYNYQNIIDFYRKA